MNSIVRAVVLISLVALGACTHWRGPHGTFRVVAVPDAAEVKAQDTEADREGHGVRATQHAQLPESPVQRAVR